MIPSRQNVLKLLKAELQFLENGGYKRSARSPWRSPYIFEESPSCPNFSDPARSTACEDCWLISFVHSDLRNEQIPCRFVQLNSEGATVDSLYRYATPAETEEILRLWLSTRIRELEEELAGEKKFPFAANE